MRPNSIYVGAVDGHTGAASKRSRMPRVDMAARRLSLKNLTQGGPRHADRASGQGSGDRSDGPGRAPTAVICGEVTMGPGTSVGCGAVLTAESGPITIGRECVIIENAVIRGTRRHAVTVGDHVLVGPGAHLSGCAIPECAFLATGTRVFNGAVVGARAEVRINATVHLMTKLPEDATVPIGWLRSATPARILPPGAHDEIGAIQEPLNFPKEVFGVDRPKSGKTRMPEIMARYCRRRLPDTATTASCEPPAGRAD